MRKALLLFLVVSLLSLTACGAAPLASPLAAEAPAAPASDDVMLGLYGGAGELRSVARVEAWAVEEMDFAEMPAEMPEPEAEPPPPGSVGTPTISLERIIHTARAEVETDEFDDTVERVYGLIERHRGFLQSANVSGRDFYAKQRDIFTHRQAHFTIRVPAGQYATMIQDIELLGAMTFLTTQAENVTAQYTDIVSRLASLRNQEERILSLFEQADTMEDILFLEDRLSQVIFDIERLTWDRNHIDSLASYSTIHLTLLEVRELVEIEDRIVIPTFGERVGSAFTGTMQGMARFARGIVLALVIILPWLLVLGVIALAPVLILLHVLKKRKAKKAAATKNQVGEFVTAAMEDTGEES